VRTKPLIRLQCAREEELEAVRYYAAEVGLDMALAFREALRTAYRAIAARPGTGSPRYGEILDLPGLRAKRLKRFPFLVFYVEGQDRIDVWHVLHVQRDIPASLAEKANGPFS
jgi:toxin ParE1/3/4